jgi:hypothetical protein
MLQNFQNYKTFVEKQIGHQLKCLRSDNGGEYISNNFNYIVKMKEFNNNLQYHIRHNKMV